MTGRGPLLRTTLGFGLAALLCLAAAYWTAMELVWAVQAGAAEVAVWNGSGPFLFFALLLALGMFFVLRPVANVSRRISALILPVAFAAFFGSTLLPNLIAGPVLRDRGYERCGARSGIRSFTALWCRVPAATGHAPAASP